ncbi:helix-turn-helix domain-containing protein [Treponema sp.]|uniref:helix-turn-helix domain-containing protein n=1 Tax=Treponema sp. TaxID=166 RepID=UPI00298D9700|nr:helix-turn-helix domain-containing protein [Treponema sp.]
MAAEYIQALIDSREKDDDSVFIDFMLNLHAQHLQREIEQFKASMSENNEKMVDILHFMSDKSQITTEELVQHFGFTPTTAKRYLRQLTEFGYLEALGGNKNRRYILKKRGTVLDVFKKNSPRSLRHHTMNHLLKAGRRNPAAYKTNILYFYQEIKYNRNMEENLLWIKMNWIQLVAFQTMNWQDVLLKQYELKTK